MFRSRYKPRLVNTILMLLATILILVSPLRVGRAQSSNDERRYNVVILVDESGSMWNDTDIEERDRTRATDPTTGLPAYTRPAARITAVQAILTSMLGEGRDVNVNVGIVSFGTGAKVAFPLQPLANNLDAAVKGLMQTHLEFDPGRGVQLTNTRDALRSAYDMLYAEGGTSRNPGKNIVLMISDGAPESSETFAARGQGRQAERARLVEALRTEVRNEITKLTTATDGGFISMIINISGDADAIANYDFWSNVATMVASNQNQAGDTELIKCGFWKMEDRNLLFGHARGVVDCIFRGTVDPPVAYVAGQPYAVEDYTDELVINILKNDPQISVEVVRPNKTPVAKQTGNDNGDDVTYSSYYQTEAYRIKHPVTSSSSWAGCWTVIISANSPPVQNPDVKFIAVPRGDYTLGFTKPEVQVWPVGKPMPVAVGVYSSTKELVNPSSIRLDQTMKLLVQAPGKTDNADLSGRGAGYEGTYTGNKVEGTYIFTSTINSAELHQPSAATAGCRGTGAATQAGKLTGQTTITMKALPWIEMVEPKEGSSTSSNKLQVRARMMMGGTPYTGRIEGSDKVEMEATLVSAANPKRKAANFPLVPASSSPGEYTSTAGAAGILPAGEYTMTVRLDSTLKGETSSDVVHTRLKLGAAEATSTPMPKPATPTNTPAPPEPTGTPVPPTPTPTPPTPCQGPDCPPEFPWFLILGALGLAGALAGGFFLYKALTGGARMDGVMLSSFSGTDITKLKGKTFATDLNGARMKFTAAPGTGQPSMTVVSSAEPVTFNGMPHEPGGSSVPLNEGDVIQVGSESYTVSGAPKAAGSRSKGAAASDEFGLGSSTDDYGSTIT